MNKTELLKEVSAQSSIQMDECGRVLKTFERVLCEELTRKMSLPYYIDFSSILNCDGCDIGYSYWC